MTGRLMRKAVHILLSIAVLLGSACGSDNSPASPTPTLTVSGTYAGDITVQATPTRMVWTVTQTANAFSGSVVMSLSSGIVLLNGIVGGTVSGTSIVYTILVSPGGLPLQPQCSGQLGGTAVGTTAAPFTISGNYSVVSSTCTTPLTGGPFVLTKT
jgi:hypothetical protein